MPQYAPGRESLAHVRAKDILGQGYGESRSEEFGADVRLAFGEA